MFLPSEVSALLSYLVPVLLLRSPEGQTDTLNSAALLTFLVIGASCGRRAIEMHERSAFLGIVKEKSMRAQAEHQLSCLADTRGREYQHSV